MNISSRFRPEKALEVLLYIIQRCPDMYTALKVLYFADKDHLSKYGRIISGDRYMALSHGPVPSNTYDMVKYVRENWSRWSFPFEAPLKEAITVNGNRIVPLREPNLDMLSPSEIECLDAAIEKYGRMSFGQIKALSHDDPAYKAADENDFIPLKAFVKSVPDGDTLWDYLNNDDA